MSILFGLIAMLSAIMSFVGLVTDDYEEYLFGGIFAVVFGLMAWWL